MKKASQREGDRLCQVRLSTWRSVRTEYQISKMVFICDLDRIGRGVMLVVKVCNGCKREERKRNWGQFEDIRYRMFFFSFCFFLFFLK